MQRLLLLALTLTLLAGCAPGALSGFLGRDERSPIERGASRVATAVPFRDMRRMNRMFTPPPFTQAQVERHERATINCGTTRSLDMRREVDGNRVIFTLLDDRGVFGQAAAEWLPDSETFALNPRIHELLIQAYRLTLDCRRF